ncbi:MAG: hypothetical protein J6P03_09205 [Opitutales bacterium]|nr:hypothetical protein [Opitutales bacterium]
MQNFKKLLSFILICAALFLGACASENTAAPIFVGEPSSARGENAFAAKAVFVAAIPDEANRIIARYGLKKKSENFYISKDIACVVTGVGGENVENALRQVRISPKIPIINIGYCGSNSHKIGDFFEVSKVSKIEDPKKSLKLSKSGAPCYTADFFVENAKISEPAVFDMELFYIRSAHGNTRSLKLVSDNLSKAEFKESIKNASWDKVLNAADEILKECGALQK